MKEQMSGRMKRMTRIYSWVMPVVFLYITAVSFFGAGMGMKLLGNTKQFMNKLSHLQ
ncbi:MAG: hypothetical protein LBN31_14445 [Hungatella sp.]|nr:hypothetical protein [Hungatella sp.]